MRYNDIMAKIARVWDGSEWVIISPATINPYPSQSGNSGKVLQTDGAVVSWQDTAFTWDSINSQWTSEENINLSSGLSIKFGGTSVLSATNYLGNAATVTNGVYTNGTYSNPSWITTLGWSKITSTPTSLLGYGITDTGAVKTYLSLQNVENTALSTWSGSINITTLGTISSGTWNASVISETYLDASLARVNSPTFSGTVVLPGTTSIGQVSNLEISYLDGVTSSIQTQLNNKLDSSTASSTYAPLASPSFSGNVSLPSTTSVGDVSSTEISYLDGVTSSIQTQLTSKAPLESPTFTGTVSGISKSMVGLGNVDNTSDANKPISTAQQTALDLKSNLSGATFTGFVTLHADPTQAMHAATKQYVDALAEGLHIHQSVGASTTSNISDLSSAPSTIDGITLANNMRVLVKNQTTTSQNGIYVYNSSTGALTRATDFDSSAEIDGGDFVFVTGGTQNDNTGWVQTETVANIGTDPVLFQQFSGAGTITAGTNISVNGNQVSVINNPTFSGLVTATSGVAFSDGTQTKQGVPSISSFISKTASYTLDSLTLRDNIIEVDSASATTITIPPDSSLNLPIGSSLDVIQINTGEVNIAAGAGVTINSTPGLKLRTRWSSCTLLKRAANSWLVYGDLKA